MRAGRLLSLMLVLQNGERVTAGELARRLQVSERTVLRDIEVLSGAGVPVYSIRGPNGGFELLDTFEQQVPALPAGLATGLGRLRRVRVRISPAAVQMALLFGKPEGWRVRPSAEPAADRPDWIEGSFRFDSYDGAVRELLALGSEIEVLLPVELRRTMGEIGRRLAERHRIEPDVRAEPSLPASLTRPRAARPDPGPSGAAPPAQR